MLLTYCRLCCGFWAWKTDNFSNWDRLLDSRKHAFERWCDLLVDTTSLNDDLLMMQSINFFSSFFFQYTLVGSLENISICSGDNLFFFFFKFGFIINSSMNNIKFKIIKIHPHLSYTLVLLPFYLMLWFSTFICYSKRELALIKWNN